MHCKCHHIGFMYLMFVINVLIFLYGNMKPLKIIGPITLLEHQYKLVQNSDILSFAKIETHILATRISMNS
eukprot:UN03901